MTKWNCCRGSRNCSSSAWNLAKSKVDLPSGGYVSWLLTTYTWKNTWDLYGAGDAAAEGVKSCRCVVSMMLPSLANIERCTSETFAPSWGPPVTNDSWFSSAWSLSSTLVWVRTKASTADSLCRSSPHVAPRSPPTPASGTSLALLAFPQWWLMNASSIFFSARSFSMPCSFSCAWIRFTYAGSFHAPPAVKSVAAVCSETMSGTVL
mmetsp:Transcript_34644/g.82086  ORF Transcript_34644/g.82086 Transcript_34644/m.82086 type:complete len:207 (-) Transcript_34644:1572-2192(-)